MPGVWRKGKGTGNGRREINRGSYGPSGRIQACYQPVYIAGAISIVWDVYVNDDQGWLERIGAVCLVYEEPSARRIEPTQVKQGPLGEGASCSVSYVKRRFALR